MNTAVHTSITAIAAPLDIETAELRSPKWTGLNCTIACERISLRELPSELMLTSTGLATSCHAISDVSAAGRDAEADVG